MKMSRFVADVNFYKSLEVEDFSSLDTVKANYRKLAMLHHPDRGGDEELMKRINYVYDILSKSIDKNLYDKWLRQMVAPVIASGYGFDFSNMANHHAARAAAAQAA